MGISSDGLLLKLYMIGYHEFRIMTHDVIILFIALYKDDLILQI